MINASGASEEIDIYADSSADEFLMLTGEISENGKLTGKVQKGLQGIKLLGTAQNITVLIKRR